MKHILKNGKRLVDFLIEYYPNKDSEEVRSVYNTIINHRKRRPDKSLDDIVEQYLKPTIKQILNIHWDKLKDMPDSELSISKLLKIKGLQYDRTFANKVGTMQRELKVNKNQIVEIYYIREKL
ncbi:MAG: hypothetical protein BWY78_00073 [Alphaproteobacteria bacterium ADurb.Bin438]|nr:MAG: hypothetical protein BWY78_00073 [Alphaproteobacteria bacterium ADurb.Bin438]